MAPNLVINPTRCASLILLLAVLISSLVIINYIKYVVVKSEVFIQQYKKFSFMTVQWLMILEAVTYIGTGPAWFCCAAPILFESHSLLENIAFISLISTMWVCGIRTILLLMMRWKRYSIKPAEPSTI